MERLVEDEEEAWNEDAGVDAMVNPVKICNFVAIFLWGKYMLRWD